MKVITLINELKKTDPYIEIIFTQGGCYKFHLFLKSIYPDAIPVINQNVDHIGSLIDGEVYDINGVVDWSFRAMDDDDLVIVERWSFARNKLLQLGECECCEEPILVGVDVTSKAWELGYKQGDACDLNKPITPPEGLSEAELKDWNRGVDAAVCDRIS